MREYRLFLGRPSGAYGDLRQVFLFDDATALMVGERLLEHVPGVDIWCDGRRIALLTRQDPEARARSIATQVATR